LDGSSKWKLIFRVIKEREIKEKVNSTFCRVTLKLSKHMIHNFFLFSLYDRLMRQHFYTQMQLQMKTGSIKLRKQCLEKINLPKERT